MSDINQRSLPAGTLVEHPAFGPGVVVEERPDIRVIAFENGERREISTSFAELVRRGDAPAAEPAPASSFSPSPPPSRSRVEDNELTRALRNLLDEYHLAPGVSELGKRWTGGTLKLIPGKTDTQPKEIPLEVFFKKIIGLRERLRVLEQRINNHPSLSSEEKLELEDYITRCYGSLTTFNVLFAEKSFHFKGTGGE